MTSKREQVLQELFELLEEALTGTKALRNENLPEKIPAGGLLILRDGDAGEPEVMLSPLSYYWQHRAQLEVAVQKSTTAGCDTALDALLSSIAAAISNDRTLGGLCDRVTALAPDTSSLSIEGAPHIRGALVPVELIYTTADQLG